MLKIAVEFLMSRGLSVEQTDIPGLFLVEGHELTIGQVIDFARQKGCPDPRAALPHP